MTAYDRKMRELLEECRSSAFDAKEYSLCDRIDAALRTPVPPIFDAFCTAREQRDEARAEVQRLRKWQESIADGTGYILRAEGQGGYEAADPETIVAAWRRLEREADAAAYAYQRGAEAMREVVAQAVLPSMSNIIRDLPIPEDK